MLYMESVFLNFNLVVPPVFLWALLLVFILVFITTSLILHHHWKYYGIGGNPKIFVKTLHWIISICLIILMAIALLAYESNF